MHDDERERQLRRRVATLLLEVHRWADGVTILLASPNEHPHLTRLRKAVDEATVAIADLNRLADARQRQQGQGPAPPPAMESLHDTTLPMGVLEAEGANAEAR